MSHPFAPQPCPGGEHAHDEHGNSYCAIQTAAQPCASFATAGYGPEGDFEHSTFCGTCGWELGDHPECLTFDECEERGLDPIQSGQGPDCQYAHGERGLPHTRDCRPI